MAMTSAGARRQLSSFVRRLPIFGPVVQYLRPHNQVLTNDEVGHFNDQGYLIFDPQIPTHTLDRAISDLANHPDMVLNLHHGSRVFDGWKISPSVREIALNHRVLQALEQIYFRKPLPFQTLNFPIGTEQRTHSDTIHFSSDPPCYMCGVWVALEDIDLENGALVYYPGSHKLPLVTMEDVSDHPGPSQYHLYEEYIDKMVREKALQPARAILKKGQSLIWAANLLHGGGSHPNKKRTRHSQVTHYYFEGCQYYTPLDSYGGYRYLRDPEWIR